MSRAFPFDLSIGRASTIPARLHVDLLFHALEQERVFGRAWQLAGGGARERPLLQGPRAPASPSWSSAMARTSAPCAGEDREICEVVHRNLRSRACDRGRYAPRQEQGVHHFHALLHEFLS